MQEAMMVSPLPWGQAHLRQPDGMYITQVFDKFKQPLCDVCWCGHTQADGTLVSLREANAKLLAAAPNLASTSSLVRAYIDPDIDDKPYFHDAGLAPTANNVTKGEFLRHRINQVLSFMGDSVSLYSMMISPAPWDYAVKEEGARRFALVSASDGEPICEVHKVSYELRNGHPISLFESNAKMFVAAPALMETLELVRAFIDPNIDAQPYLFNAGIGSTFSTEEQAAYVHFKINRALELVEE